MKIPHTVPKLILRAYTSDGRTNKDEMDKMEEEDEETLKSSRKSATFAIWDEKFCPSTLAQQCVDLVIKDYTFLTTLTDEMNKLALAKHEAVYQKWKNKMEDYRQKRETYERKILESQLKKAQRMKRLKAKRALLPFSGGGDDDEDDEDDKFGGGLSKFRSVSILQLQQLHLPKEPTPLPDFEPWKPILDRLDDEDRVQVVDGLQVQEIPLPVAIRTIRDEHYWERASKQRWPQCENDEHDNSWQQTYMEKHLMDALEQFHPFTDDLSLLMEQVELVASHVRQLILLNLIPCCFGVESTTKIFKPFIADEELTGEDEGFAIAGYLRQAQDIQNLLHDDEQHMDGGGGEAEIESLRRLRDNSHFDLSQVMGHLKFLRKLCLIYEMQNIGMDWEARYFDFTDKDVRNLAKALTLAPTIQHFELNQSRMTGLQCQILVRDGLKNMKNLQVLNISYNNIGDEGAKTIAELLIGDHNPVDNKLHTLSMVRNHIMDAGAGAVATALTSNCQLVSLDLRLNYISDVGGKEFGLALNTNKALLNFNLAANRITKESCSSFAEMFQRNATLKQLDLSSNNLGHEGGVILAEAIRTNSKIINMNIRLSNTGFQIEQTVESHVKKNHRQLQYSILDKDLL